MKRLVGIAAGCALLAAAPCGAQDGPDKRLSLTIYNDNLALVEHVRPLELAAGRRRIEFKGVSAAIIPQTVSFRAAGVELLEQNFDFDLLTPQKLMEKAVGQNVQIVRTNPGTGAETRETAEVLSTVGGVVLKIGERIEVLREDGIPSRVIFDKVPPNLRATPTLSVLVDAERPVNGDVTLAYLSHGLSWRADYVAVFDEPNGSVALQGWITLTNSSGTTFENAHAQLVAGDVNVSDNQVVGIRPRAPNVRRAAGTESSNREQLADYYVYPIAQATTIANNQTKQVSFLSADRVRADKGYEQTFYGFQSLEQPISAEVRVRFANSKEAGLGEQLPAGVVRVYARDARGAPQFVGEDQIGHTSAGSELAIKIGDAFDVTVQPTLRQTTRVSRRDTDYAMSYALHNARTSPVTVTIRQQGLPRFNEVREQSIEGRRTSATSFAWDVPVPANGDAELAFTIRQGG
ncbi:MAG TPA: DUF4139 domain-containing protein [Gammaproteobacteria bacterium]|nr:DUF4139 domain-containing protein [Gammaproteobacteria bacterium]